MLVDVVWKSINKYKLHISADILLNIFSIFIILLWYTGKSIL